MLPQRSRRSVKSAAACIAVYQQRWETIFALMVLFVFTQLMRDVGNKWLLNRKTA
jgi:hypothetical protein